MKKLISAGAVCAVAVGLVAVPNALGVKSAKQVGGTVTVSATPTTIDATTASVNASGSVASNSSLQEGPDGPLRLCQRRNRHATCGDRDHQGERLVRSDAAEADGHESADDQRRAARDR